MAINSSRSMTTDMREGGTDGKYLKARPNTGGSTMNDEANLRDKATLDERNGYGPGGSAPSQSLPDGTKK